MFLKNRVSRKGAKDAKGAKVRRNKWEDNGLSSRACGINFLKVVLLNISKRQNLKSPSFPHALSGTRLARHTELVEVESRRVRHRTPTETFGGDAVKTILMQGSDTPCLLWGCLLRSVFTAILAGHGAVLVIERVNERYSSN